MADFDYVTVGHVTVDVIERAGAKIEQAGGGAFYSALQASRLGLKAMILTQGNERELEELLAPYRAELAWQVIPAEQTTRLATSGEGSERVQRMLAWAGAIEELPAFESSIVHLAPVAKETPPGLVRALYARAPGERFFGVTPQGLIRSWTSIGGEIEPVALAVDALPERYDAVVLSAQETGSCAALLQAIPRSGSVIAVTDGPKPVLVHAETDGKLETSTVTTPSVLHPVDDLGAGDVFAAGFFVALSEGASPEQAALRGGGAAALRISAQGTAAIGDRPKIEALLQQTQKHSR